MPTPSPHSSLIDLIKASQGIGDDKRKSPSRDGSKMTNRAHHLTISDNRSPHQNFPTRPPPVMNRRRTTGDVTKQDRAEYYASLQHRSNGPMKPTGATAYSMPHSSFNGGMVSSIGAAGTTSPNTASWNAGPTSPTRRTGSPDKSSSAYGDHQGSYASHHRRLSAGALQVPEINNLHINQINQINQAAPAQVRVELQNTNTSYVNPFEDPALVGDLSQSVPMTQVRSFPSAAAYHPLEHRLSVGPVANPSGEQLAEARPLHPITHVRSFTTGHLPQTTVPALSGGINASASPTHKHSEFDPLRNTTRPRSLPSANIFSNSTGDMALAHKQSLTLDTASLADIAAQLSTLKPQKKDAGSEDKKNHLITLGTNPVESTGTKKSHRKFLSQPFSRKGGPESEDNEEKNGHKRSISAGLAAVFKRDDDGEKDVGRSTTPNKRGSPLKGSDGVGSAERPTTPGRRMGLGLRRNARSDKNAEAQTLGLEVIQSASGEDQSPNQEIKLRSSEQDPSPHQVSIPSANDLVYSAKLCELLEQYRVIDQNFAFDSLVGMTRGQMYQFLQDKNSNAAMITLASPDSSRPTSSKGAVSPVALPMDPVSNSLTGQQQQLMETHVPIVSSLFDADDLVAEGFYHEVCNASNNKTFDSTNEKSTRDRMEVAIFKNDSQRQFLVVYQGCAEAQMKPIKKGEQKDGIDRRFQLGKKDDDNRFSEEQPVVVFPPFRKAYFNSDVEAKVFTKLDDLVEEHPFFDVVMTGHSFGGVLALLSSMRYANVRPQIMISCFAFGCPKIGTTDFRYYVNSLPNLRVMRVEYGCDPWINAPDHPNWCHAGHTIAICKCIDNSNADNSEGSGEIIVRAFKFGENRPDSGGREGRMIGKILSRQTNKEKQMDHDIASCIHSLEQVIGYGVGSAGLWPDQFVGEEGIGVEGLDKEKRLVC